MGAVMQRGPDKLALNQTLLALADNADDHGFSCPSIAVIAMKGRCDTRTAIRRLQQLEREQWIRIERRVVGDSLKGSAYLIDIAKLGVQLNAKSKRSRLWAHVERLLAERAARRPAERNLRLQWTREAPAATPSTLDLFAPSSDKMSPDSSDIFAPDQVTFADASGDISSDPYLIKVLNRSVEPSIETNTAPTPASGGRVSDDLILPASEVRFGDPHFALNLGIAARWVMAHCGMAPGGRGKSKATEEEIAKALELRARTERSRPTLEELAALGVNNWKVYVDLGEAIRFPLGLMNFFVTGAWCSPKTWRYDRVEMARRELAARPQPAAAAPWTAERELVPEPVPEGVDVARGVALWAEMRARLEAMVPKQSFDTWLRPLRAEGVLDGVLYLRIPSRQFEHLVDKYEDEFADVLPEGVVQVVLLSYEEAKR